MIHMSMMASLQNYSLRLRVAIGVKCLQRMRIYAYMQCLRAQNDRNLWVCHMRGHDHFMVHGLDEIERQLKIARKLGRFGTS